MILAPTTMLTPQGVRIKTDMRDAYMIAQCLSYGGYHALDSLREKTQAQTAYTDLE